MPSDLWLVNDARSRWTALERILEPELYLAVTRDGQSVLQKVRPRDGEDLIESVGAQNIGDVGK